jgi:hypothetical protein
MQKDLIDKLLKASETIHKSSTKGSANYMVVSQDVANIINGIKRDIRKGKIKRLFPDKIN